MLPTMPDYVCDNVNPENADTFFYQKLKFLERT